MKKTNLYTAILLGVAFLFMLGLESCLKDLFDDPDDENEPDIEAPVIYIQTPTAEPSYSTIEQNLTITGMAQDNQNINRVQWNINGGVTSDAIGQGDWTAENVLLADGDNIFIAYAEDISGNLSTDTCIITNNKYLVFLGAPITNPSGVFINQETAVSISVQIAPNANLQGNSVDLIKLDENNNEVEVICSLFDDGDLQHGDDILGDNIFSNKYTFTLDSPLKLRVKAVTAETEGDVTGYSAIITLKAFQPLENSETEYVLSTHSNAVDKLNELIANNDFETTVQQTVDWLKGQADILDVFYEDGIIEIAYSSGLKSHILITFVAEDGSKTLGGMPPSGQERSVNPHRVNNPPLIGDREQKIPLDKQTTGMPLHGDRNDVLKNIILDRDVFIWEPFKSNFAPFDPGAQVISEFNQSDLDFNIVHLSDQQCTIESLYALPAYGFVLLNTHGLKGKGFLTGQLVQEGDDYKLLRKEGKVGIIHKVEYGEDWIVKYFNSYGDMYAVSDDFIRSLGGSFPNSVIMNISCSSTYAPFLYSAFLSKGAKSYLGVDNISHSRFMNNVTIEYVRNLLKEDGTTGKALYELSNRIDPEAPNAYFELWGSTEMHYSSSLINGDFETGDLTGWNSMGDGRVIPQLGFLLPPQGSFMGIISTGLGGTTSSGQISQSFTLGEDETKIKLKWNFLSEEFLEYIGSQYQDYFTVIIQEGGVESTEFHKTIDGFDAAYSLTKVSPGIVFDQGDVYMTGWQPMEIPIGNNYRDKEITIRFIIGDVGDSSYDSAVLLDEIEVVEE